MHSVDSELKKEYANMYNAEIEEKKESPLFYFNKELLDTQDKESYLQMSEVSGNAYFVLRGDKNSADLEQALYKHLKLYLPQNPREMAKSVCAAIYYISFDEWLIVVDEVKLTTVDAHLRADLSGHVQLVDNTGGMTQLNMQGQTVHTLLQKLCNYDFHPSHFPVGACVQTKIAKTSGLVVRWGEYAFALYIRRSFCDYITAWCLDAAVDC
ncbi:MAG: sarcosine oxidase subunit gamma family protein [Coxiellaceae bacterium]|nr:sarcosine oxidase subunit gamma family protein [Coxiellaceae bacterium]